MWVIQQGGSQKGYWDSRVTEVRFPGAMSGEPEQLSQRLEGGHFSPTSLRCIFVALPFAPPSSRAVQVVYTCYYDDKDVTRTTDGWGANAIITVDGDASDREW